MMENDAPNGFFKKGVGHSSLFREVWPSSKALGW